MEENGWGLHGDRKLNVCVKGRVARRLEQEVKERMHFSSSYACFTSVAVALPEIEKKIHGLKKRKD